MINLERHVQENNYPDAPVRFEVNDITKYNIKADVVLLTGILSYFKNFQDILSNIIRNDHEIVIMQYAPRNTKKLKFWIIAKLVRIWARMRKLKVFRHSEGAVIEYMNQNGYRLGVSTESEDGITVRFEKLSQKEG